MIEIENLTKRFGDRTVLDDVSLSVANGEILAVVGPSGAGKTTLSRCVSFLERPTSGTVRVDGKDFTRLEGAELLAARRSVGVIFQTAPLLRRRTVAQNVALPLEYLGATDASVEKRVTSLLDRVGLADRRDDLPGPALRRPEAAGRDRPCARPRPVLPAVRRGDLGAGPEHDEVDPRPAQPPSRRVRPRDHPDHPRDGGRPRDRRLGGPHRRRPHHRERFRRRRHPRPHFVARPRTAAGPARVCRSDGAGEVWEVSYASREVPLDWLTSIHTVPGIAERAGERAQRERRGDPRRGGRARAVLAISPSAPAGFERYLRDRGLHVTAAVHGEIRRRRPHDPRRGGGLQHAVGQGARPAAARLRADVADGRRHHGAGPAHRHPVGITLHNTSDFGLYPEPEGVRGAEHRSSTSAGRCRS